MPVSLLARLPSQQPDIEEEAFPQLEMPTRFAFSTLGSVDTGFGRQSGPQITTACNRNREPAERRWRQQCPVRHKAGHKVVESRTCGQTGACHHDTVRDGRLSQWRAGH
jgi:hypothetical protein